MAAFAALLTALAATAPRASDAATPPAETHSAANIVLGVGSGVTQPMIENQPMSSCSLGVGSGYTWGFMRIMHFDPETLLPDPTTVALRTARFTPSNLASEQTWWSNHGRMDFETPLVLRSVDHVADVPSTPVAIDWVVQSQNQLSFFYDDDANPVRPIGYRYTGSAPRTPLPGPYPVLNYVARPALGDAAHLWVVQAVTASTEPLGLAASEFAQRFRVPVVTSVASIELAISSYEWQLGYPWVPIDVEIHAGSPNGPPPQQLPPPMIESFLSADYRPALAWFPVVPFDYTTILHPGVDYWLVIRTAHLYDVFARNLTGLEGPDFTSAIGTLHQRVESGAPWQEVADRAMSFRLIGSPYTLLDAAVPVPSRFRLTAAPNPARHGTQLAWSGARGQVRLDVLDLHGRRIESREVPGGASGSWFWNGSGPDGRRLAEGTYFIRARDEAGEVAVHRVVLIR
jgi:hypothetical protein